VPLDAGVGRNRLPHALNGTVRIDVGVDVSLELRSIEVAERRAERNVAVGYRGDGNRFADRAVLRMIDRQKLDGCEAWTTYTEHRSVADNALRLDPVANPQRERPSAKQGVCRQG